MAKFACKHCHSKIRVPDEFIGKRVKCPGCAKPIEVPGERPAASTDPEESLDLSLLDDSLAGAASVKPRKLRSIMIGCGACGKTIAVPENRMGAIHPCPKCHTPLKVDRLDLPATTGSTINFKHISLDPADEPSLAGESFAGGSMAGLTGTVGGSVAGASGSMSGAGGSYAGNAQEQMKELKTLNDLRADGAISDDEYRRRKAEIYSGGGGASMARKATSRSAGGASDRAIRVNTGPSIPRPAKWVIVLAMVGGLGYGAWVGAPTIKKAVDDLLYGTSAEVLAEREAAAKAEAEAKARAARKAQADAEAKRAEASRQPEVVEVVEVPVDPAMDVMMVEPGVPILPEESAVARDGVEGAPGPAGSGEAAAQAGVSGLMPRFPDASVAHRPPPRPAGSGVGHAGNDGAVQGKIAFWPAMFPEARTSHPMRRVCSIVREIRRGNTSALIGVGVGPPAKDTDDLAYRKFEAQTRQVMVNAAGQDGAFKDMILRARDTPQRDHGIEMFVYTGTSTNVGDRGRQVSILTGVQDGYCVTYWFAGHTRLYKTFREYVGTAVLE